MSETFLSLQEKYPIVTNTVDIAAKNGVAASFFEYNDELFFVVSPDKETLSSLSEHMDHFNEILRENERRGGQWFNCYFNIYRLDDVKKGDVFRVHQDLCNMILRQSLVKTVYHMHGYHMPKYVCMQSISNYEDFYQKTHDRTLPDRLREEYKTTLLKQVAMDYDYYAKLENEPLYTKKVPLSIFQKNNHEVDKDYFRKNHITQVNEVVRPAFITYMKQHLKEHPNFVYYLDKKPFARTEDISHIANGDDNFWEDMTGDEFYNISFPIAQSDDYYCMVLQYNMQSYENMIPLKEMHSQELLSCPINKNDIWNVNSLCGANGVKFAVDFGEINPVSANSIYQIPVYFRSEDRQMVSAILTRLSKEREGYIPIDLHDADLADKNKPKEYHNPFFTDRQLQTQYKKQAIGTDR